jgi:hypothetical protein
MNAKNNFFKVSAVVLALALVFGFTACGGGSGGGNKSSEAKLLTISFATVAFTPLPQPINASTWDDASTFAGTVLEADQTAEVIVERTVNLDAFAITFTASAGASVEFGRASGNNKPGASGPTAFAAAPATYTISNNQYLYVRVIAEDGTVNYYRFHIQRKSLVTTLTSLVVAGKTITLSDNLNSSEEGWDDITTAAAGNISISAATNATVTATPTNEDAEVLYAVVPDGSDTDPVFGDGHTFTFTDGDMLYIQVTSSDAGESATRWYKVEVMMGRDATLSDILFAGANNADAQVTEFGEPADTLSGITDAGYLLMPMSQPTAGFSVSVTPSDPDATVKFGKADEAEASWTSTSPQIIKFEDEEFLAIRVESGNHNVIKYYKISVELLPTMYIPYGTPSLINPSDSTDAKYIDPKWDAITNWISIAKQNRVETTQEFYDNPSTTAKAKLYWDEDGLWLYVDVTGPVSTNTGFAHEGSSVELFINEAYPTIKTGNHSNTGGQYRVDSNGAISGDPSVAVTAFTALNQKNAFKTTGGYAVIFQAPWRFAATYPLKDEKPISLEIQVNAARTSGNGRVGVLKWYNTTANTYQNASALAPGFLDLNGATMKPQRPSITAQPANARIALNAAVPELQVTAVSPDGGSLSYQWYSSTSATNFSGTLVSGAVNATFTPSMSTAAAGDSFFYVVVTNTKDAQNVTSTSSMARITVYDPAVEPPNLELVNSTLTGWDAIENALVIENASGWGASNSFTEIVALPIPSSAVLTEYLRLDIVADLYVGDVKVTTFSQYSNDIAYNLYNGAGTRITQQYNAGANGAFSWSLTADEKAADYAGGQGKVVITAGNKSNAITKIVVKSVMLVYKD